MSLEQSRVRKPKSTAAAGIRPLSRVDLHVKLDVSELPEPHAADLALVGLLPRVDPQVPQVVRVDPERLAAVLARVRLLPGVLQLVGLERLADDEPLPAHVAPERPLPRVDPLVVVVRGFVEERLPARVAAVLLPPRVNELVSPQRARRVEALAAGPAAERRHVHRGFVLPIDDSAVASGSFSDDLAVSFVVGDLLVSLQLAVVEKRLAAQVAHERLGGAVKEHVRFQLVLNEALPAHVTFEGFLARVDANVPLQVVLQGEARSARLAREHFPPVDGLVRPERPPPVERFAAHRAFVRVLPRVDAFVALQRERVPETLAALGALVRLFDGVHDLVGPQRLLGFEGLPAGGAREGPRVRVDELVGLQVHFGLERLLAETALEGGVLPLLVPQQVVLEGRRIPEFPRALVAGERPLLSVSVGVLRQMKAPVEALVADSADEGLPFALGWRLPCVLAVSVLGFGRVCRGVTLCSF